jgi:hypothetical protein
LYAFLFIYVTKTVNSSVLPQTTAYELEAAFGRLLGCTWKGALWTLNLEIIAEEPKGVTPTNINNH